MGFKEDLYIAALRGAEALEMKASAFAGKSDPQSIEAYRYSLKNAAVLREMARLTNQGLVLVRREEANE